MKSNLISLVVGSLFWASKLSAAPEGGGKRVSVCDKSFEENDEGVATGVVRFTFSDGEEVAVDVNSFSPEIQKRLQIHGLLQKGGDSYAGAKGNVGEAKESLKQIIEQLTSGAWKGERGDAGPRIGELIEAIAEIRNAPRDKVEEAVKAATDEQRKAWRSNAKVKSVIAAQRARKAAAEADAAGEQALDINV